MTNVVVVMLDTLRPDSLGAGGHPYCETPALDRLAAEGAFFTNAYAEYPITVPTRTALVAGIYTFTNRPWTPLQPYDLHIAEIFRDAGYDTAAFTDSPFREVVNMHRGFDEFREYPTKLQAPDPEPPDVDERGAAFPPGAEDEAALWHNCAGGFLSAFPQQHGGRIGIELLVDDAIDWLGRRDTTRPFFLWLDTFQPHEPWIPPPPWDTRYQAEGYSGRFLPMPAGPATDWMSDEELDHVRALYLGEVSYTDVHVGRLFDHLDRAGLAEDTIVVVLSDHGQPLGEHGTIRKFGVPLYDELAKITWIMRAPGLITPGMRVDGLAQTPDFLPTMLELCGLVANPTKVWAAVAGSSTGLDGVSVAPLLDGRADSVRDTAYIGAFGLRSGIRAGSLKLIDNHGEKPNELYDLSSDPAEQDNLAAKEPDTAAELHRRLWDFRARWSGMLAWRDRPADADPGKR